MFFSGGNRDLSISITRGEHLIRNELITMSNPFKNYENNFLYFVSCGIKNISDINFTISFSII